MKDDTILTDGKTMFKIFIDIWESTNMIQKAWNRKSKKRERI